MQKLMRIVRFARGVLFCLCHPKFAFDILIARAAGLK